VSDCPYITCRELIDFIADYLDGDLPGDQRREFDRHLAVCPACVNYLRSYCQTVALGREAFREPDEPVDASVPAELLKAIRVARTRPPD
jgi:anti-sigma factor RsiW